MRLNRAKKTRHYKERLQEQIRVLLDEIEQVSEKENKECADADLEELGGNGGINADKLQKKVDELNEVLNQQPENKGLKKVVKQIEKDALPRMKKYEEQERVLAGRNSYSRTDPDASNLRMKEDRVAQKPLSRPAYNVQTGTEGQFIVG